MKPDGAAAIEAELDADPRMKLRYRLAGAFLAIYMLAYLLLIAFLLFRFFFLKG